jgi:hypothetical protein
MLKRVLENPIIAHLLKKFPAFYGTQGFTGISTRAHQ